MGKQASFSHDTKMVASIYDMDRDQFGLGMCRIMYARKLSFAFSCKSAADARRIENKIAYDDVAKLIQEASFYIDPQRWMTMQFEMGYSSMDVGAVTEAEKWLNQCKHNIDRTKSSRSNQGAIQHWSKMKSSCETRLIQLPLMKTLRLTNPGFLQACETEGDECAMM